MKLTFLGCVLSSEGLNWSKFTFFKVYQNRWEYQRLWILESYLFYISENMKASRRKVWIDKIHVFESLAIHFRKNESNSCKGM